MDLIIVTELPNKENNHVLFEIVTENMIRGPVMGCLDCLTLIALLKQSGGFLITQFTEDL